MAVITIPHVVWNFIFAGVQAIFSRAMLLAERGATKTEIEAHIAKMKNEDAIAQAELDRLRKENP